MADTAGRVTYTFYQFSLINSEVMAPLVCFFDEEQLTSLQ